MAGPVHPLSPPGRRAIGSVTVVGLATVEIVPADQARLALLLSAPVAGAVRFSFTRGGTDSPFLVLHAGNPPVLLDRAVFGEIPLRRIVAVGTIAGQPIVAAEIFREQD